MYTDTHIITPTFPPPKTLEDLLSLEALTLAEKAGDVQMGGKDFRWPSIHPPKNARKEAEEEMHGDVVFDGEYLN